MRKGHSESTLLATPPCTGPSRPNVTPRAAAVLVPLPSCVAARRWGARASGALSRCDPAQLLSPSARLAPVPAHTRACTHTPHALSQAELSSRLHNRKPNCNSDCTTHEPSGRRAASGSCYAISCCSGSNPEAGGRWAPAGWDPEEKPSPRCPVNG